MADAAKTTPKKADAVTKFMTDAEVKKAEDRDETDQIADYHKTHPTLKPKSE